MKKYGKYEKFIHGTGYKPAPQGTYDTNKSTNAGITRKDNTTAMESPPNILLANCARRGDTENNLNYNYYIRAIGNTNTP